MFTEFVFLLFTASLFLLKCKLHERGDVYLFLSTGISLVPAMAPCTSMFHKYLWDDCISKGKDGYKHLWLERVQMVSPCFKVSGARKRLEPGA